MRAINSPLLQDVCIRGAKGLLVNITGPQDMGIHELNDASNIIYEEAGDGANIFLGCVLDPDLTDEIRVTVIATGLNGDGDVEQKPLVDLKFNSPEKEVKEEEYSIPTYERKQNEHNPGIEIPAEKSVETKEDEPTHVFGDEYDNVPAFIRNRDIQ